MCIDWNMVSKRIGQRRRKLEMSREEVAKRIGRSPKYYGDIERGSCKMSVGTLADLSSVLNMSVDYMLYGDEEETDLYKKVYQSLKKHDVRTQRRAISLMNFYLMQEEGNS